MEVEPDTDRSLYAIIVWLIELSVHGLMVHMIFTCIEFCHCSSYDVSAMDFVCLQQDVKKVAGAVGEQSKVLAGNLADVGDDVAGDVKDNAEPTAKEVVVFTHFAELFSNRCG